VDLAGEPGAMLFNEEQVGTGSDPDVDISVDPVDGTTAAAKGLSDAVAVVGLSERGTMFDPEPCVCMDKFVLPESAGDSVDPTAPTSEILASVAKATQELTVAVLDRPRHDDLIEDIRTAGQRSSSSSTVTSPGRSPWGNRDPGWMS
jgi:fructose-1,6-bisphosphatase II